jgi:hypothetical protein
MTDLEYAMKTIQHGSNSETAHVLIMASLDESEYRVSKVGLGALPRKVAGLAGSMHRRIVSLLDKMDHPKQQEPKPEAVKSYKVDASNPDPLRQLVNELRQQGRYTLADGLCKQLNDRDRLLQNQEGPALAGEQGMGDGDEGDGAGKELEQQLYESQLAEDAFNSEFACCECGFVNKTRDGHHPQIRCPRSKRCGQCGNAWPCEEHKRLAKRKR